ncbi:hypothetical protein AALA52_09985 [Lactococcus ileimucosae]|uniref:Uncharacterized protein n=1 Tax=Lactococcus ileimucosae TaxID=2941329 RepID=A0ABV4D5T8_9LACT
MNYTITHIPEDYKMTAFGVTFEDFNDWAGNAQKTAQLKQSIIENGALAELAKKSDGQIYQINYANEAGARRGFGVMGAFSEVANTDVFEFLAGDYLVFEMTGDDKNTLADQLTGYVFGQALSEITEWQYIGPGNATATSENPDGSFTATMTLRAQKVEA